MGLLLPDGVLRGEFGRDDDDVVAYAWEVVREADDEAMNTDTGPRGLDDE